MKTRRVARGLAVAAAVFALAQDARAYYFFVHYFTRSAPWQPVPEKFDLNALQNKTVPVLISDQGPALAPGDTAAGLISQIRLAAKAWNDVESSDLRLAFGGFFSQGAQHSSPVIEVVFGEVPPGLIALTTAQLNTDASAAATRPSGENFVAISKSVVMLDRDLTSRPSWTEAFFLTAVHEFGHAIGLQHGFVSGVMSTEVTRATTKARPLALDDTIGTALLYPARPVQGGSISGRVALGANGVNLASVVAISLDGAAVGAFTNPDGTYRIDGLPQGSYYVYAHPPPPRVGGEADPGGVMPPLDFNGQPQPFRDNFETLFHPQARTFDRAVPVAVGPGAAASGINFSVTSRAAPALFGVQTFSFPGQVAVRPAHLSQTVTQVVASGYGLGIRATAAALGPATVTGVRPYAADNRFLAMDVQFNLAAGEGPRHLAFTLDNDTYVLPAGIRLMRRLPPSIVTVTPTQDVSGRSLIVAGSNIGSDTQILFDGVPGTIRQADDATGILLVTPPPAPSGHRATLVALNRDGQSSLFLQSSPTAYEFENNGDTSFVVSPNQLPAGSDAMVEVLANNGNFVTGQMSLMIGSASVQVRRIWVTGPNRLLANVSILPGGPATVTATVSNGLRLSSVPAGFSLAPATARLRLRGPVADANGRQDIPVGGLATVQVFGAEGPASALQVTVNDRPATVVNFAGSALSFRVPAGLAQGPAVVRVIAGPDSSSLVMGIDSAPPSIVSVSAGPNRIDQARPARPGELLTAILSGTADLGVDIAASRIAIQAGPGALETVVSVAPSPGGHQLQFLLSDDAFTGERQLTIAIDGRVSPPYTLPVRSN